MPDLGLTDSLGTQAQAPALQPQSQGILGGLGNLLAHPAVQAALASYFGILSTPRRFGLGAAIGQGGLAGLGQYGQAQLAQTEAQRGQLESIKTQEEIRKDRAREQAIQGLPADQRAYAEIDPSFVGEIAKQGIVTKANKSALDGLAIAYKNDPQASALIGAYYGSPASVDLSKVVETIQKVKTGDLSVQKAITDIQKNQLEAQKYQGEIALQPLSAQEKEASIAEKGVSAAKSRAEMSLIPARASELAASTGHLQAETANLPKNKANAQINKVNTDIRGFLAVPGNVGGDHDETVNRVTTYATNLNPGVDPNTIRASAESIVPATGFGTKVEQAVGSMLGGINPAAALTPPAGATHEILGPDGNVAGHLGADGRPVWLPGKDPTMTRKTLSTSIVPGD